MTNPESTASFTAHPAICDAEVAVFNAPLRTELEDVVAQVLTGAFSKHKADFLKQYFFMRPVASKLYDVITSKIVSEIPAVVDGIIAQFAQS